MKIFGICFRPLWVEYPQDPATFALDDEFLIGKITQDKNTLKNKVLLL